ncbi:hypothetical protein IWW50_004449 [Coemansia erecta]|nr:hypothetical protein IWW50_004449 [Coemansia erecta]
MKFLAALTAFSAFAAAEHYQRTAGQDLCCAVNAKRAVEGVGLPAYLWSPALEKAAQGHSDYMQATGIMGHYETSIATHDLSGRLDNVDFAVSNATEQLAMGFATTDKTVESWKNTLDSNIALFSTVYTVCGGGVSNPGSYSDVIFALPKDEGAYYTLDCDGSKSNGADLA